jgi:hypothetical protein
MIRHAAVWMVLDGLGTTDDVMMEDGLLDKGEKEAREAIGEIELVLSNGREIWRES